MNPLVLSGSSLNIYLECPKQWEYAYLWAKRTPPSYKMALGTAAHAAVEVGLREKMDLGTLPPLSVWLDAFDDTWNTETRFSRPKNDTYFESAEAHRKSGHQVVAFYRETIAPTIEPFAVEIPMSITINGHVWTGTIDLIEKVNDGYRLRDHKFTSKRPDSSARYKKPMVGYALGVKALFGSMPEEVVLDYIIRNKQPVHYKLTVDVQESDTLDLATDIEEVVQAIEAGRFPPLGRDSGACRWCPYRKTCPDSTVRSANG